MKFFIEHWKELLVLGGAISLPAIGFLSSSPEWSQPGGYYTQVSLTIENSPAVKATSASYELGAQGSRRDYQLIPVGSPVSQPATKTPDLLAEFPLKNLDKSNWWRYCLPKNSKLSESASQTSVANTSTEEKDCSLSWWKKSNDANSEIVSYLLDLMLKFLKLQHQINLITLFHLSTGSKVASGSDSLFSQIKTTCEITDVSQENSFLSYMFTSSTPISKKCLITPVKMNMTLKTSDTNGQVVATSAATNSTYSLEQLKKGVISGNIEYSITDYYGTLHKFSSNGGSGNSSTISIALVPSHSKYEFHLDNGASGSDNNKLDFHKLYKKYQSRDLKMEDFKKSQQPQSK